MKRPEKLMCIGGPLDGQLSQNLLDKAFLYAVPNPAPIAYLVSHRRRNGIDSMEITKNICRYEKQQLHFGREGFIEMWVFENIDPEDWIPMLVQNYRPPRVRT